MSCDKNFERISERRNEFMLWTLLLFVSIIICYVIISDRNKKWKETKGICKETGATCTSPTGCTCGDSIEQHQH